jgi:hypothetical protein
MQHTAGGARLALPNLKQGCHITRPLPLVEGHLARLPTSGRAQLYDKNTKPASRETVVAPGSRVHMVLLNAAAGSVQRIIGTTGLSCVPTWPGDRDYR